MGLVPAIPKDNPFETYAREHGIPFDNIGNSRKTGQIMHGTESGRNIINTIEPWAALIYKTHKQTGTAL